MAAASASASASPTTVASSAYHLPPRKRIAPPPRLQISPSLRQQKRLPLVVRSSGEETATAVDQEDPQTPMEVPKGPPSLISALNVEKALRGLAITDADHYGRLGLSKGCSYDEVNVGYRSKVMELTNKGLDEEEVSKELELLKESHTILSTVEERRLYDWSLERRGKADKYVWPFEEPEDEWLTTLTGYFFISWFILSLVLFVALNR